jgi:NAD(P)-dependent dehydrogenase (short-subunit alcohol dehydrogenase family)
MVVEALERFGRIDVLVNNAGVYAGGVPVTETSEEQWNAAVDVNLKGPFLCTKHVARHVTARGGGGRVITNSSTSALVGILNQVAYQSSKHGVVGQVRTLALELAPHGITVNTVCPTVVTTPMLDHLLELGSAYFQTWRASAARRPCSPAPTRWSLAMSRTPCSGSRPKHRGT